MDFNNGWKQITDAEMYTLQMRRQQEMMNCEETRFRAKQDMNHPVGGPER